MCPDLITHLSQKTTRSKIQILHIFDLKPMTLKLYLTKFSEKEQERIKMCCINIHLTGISFTLTRTTYVNYCTWLLHTVWIKRCMTKKNSVQILQICWTFFRVFTDTIQSLMMEIKLFSMILNTMQIIIFSRLSEIALYPLN